MLASAGISVIGVQVSVYRGDDPDEGQCQQCSAKAAPPPTPTDYGVQGGGVTAMCCGMAILMSEMLMPP